MTNRVDSVAFNERMYELMYCYLLPVTATRREWHATLTTL